MSGKFLCTVMIPLFLAAIPAAAADDQQPGAKVAGPAPRQLPPPAARPAPPPMGARAPLDPVQARGVEKMGPGMYRLGEIMIQKRMRGVSFPAVVNMEKGLLEYLVVRNGGKTHESLLRTAVEPKDLQVALLLLGLEGAERPQAVQGEAGTPEGESVQIRITYSNRDGKVATIGPEAWIVRKEGEKTVEPQPFSWVFTGSLVRGQQFLAQMDGSMVAVYHDPVALVDNASDGGENDRVWFVNEKDVPPAGTAVTVTIIAR